MRDAPRGPTIADTRNTTPFPATTFGEAERRRYEALGADLRALVDSALNLGEGLGYQLIPRVARFLTARMELLRARPSVPVLHGSDASYAASFPVPYFCEERFWVGRYEGCWGMTLAPHLLDGTVPDRLHKTLVHGFRHGYQVEVIDNLHRDRRQREWRIAWGEHGPLAGPCPEPSSALERDAVAFVNAVWRGYSREGGRQMTLAAR